MAKPKKLSPIERVYALLSISWVQWLLVAVALFFISWALMGSGINSCSGTTTAFNSDSTGGFAWAQWASGNHLLWGHTNKSNFPFGEDLNQPQYVTSVLFLLPYRLFSVLTTPICGLNLMILMAYMSCGLLMFGLIKWLLKRADIAFFAALAAAFVPYHIVKSYSHVNYMFGSIFIGLIWAYLWFIKRPSYRRAVVLSLVASIGYYFDGYFVLMSSVLIAALFSSSFVLEAIKFLVYRSSKVINKEKLKTRFKYLLVSCVVLFVLLLPILIVNVVDGQSIRQTLATARTSIVNEAMAYGSRPLDFLLPSYNSAIMPHGYANWRNHQYHGSNFTESNLYIGYTIIVLVIVSLAYLLKRQYRKLKFQNMEYQELVFTLIYAFIICFALSLPPMAYVFRHNVPTLTDILIKISANWRVLSRFFQIMDPLAVVMASLGLYVLIKNLRYRFQLLIIAACTLILFFEYLPSPLHPAANININAPQVYKDIAKDKTAKLIAVYPLASFADTPTIFTFQPAFGKTLVNANNSNIASGPYDTSIAGLNDPQTLGVLKALKVNVLVADGIEPHNSGLTPYYSLKPSYNPNGSISIGNSYFAYKINDTVSPHYYDLVTESGYISPLVHADQISHRVIASQATMKVMNFSPAPVLNENHVSFSAASVCPAKAQVTVAQNGRTLYSGYVGDSPTQINLVVGSGDFTVTTGYCIIDVTNLDAAN